jgi:glycosyltransferase involved in cell wall biosynthesis
VRAKRPQKIALVSDAVYPFNKGGKETRIYQLTTQLVKLGYDVHIYTMQWWKGSKTYTQDGVTYHAICKLYPLYSGERRSIKEGVLFGVACLKLIKYDFDILDVDHMPFFPLYSAKIVSLIRRRPLYATWHEVWGRAYWQEYMAGISGTIAYLIERCSVWLPDHIVAVSDHTAHRLRAELGYKGKLSMVTNGIDYMSIVPVKSAAQKSDVVYAGRLLAHKNVDMLVRGIAIVRQEFPNVRCVIVGDGPEFAKLQALVRKLKLEGNIHMTGFVETSDEVFAHMKASKVFVTPSIREGFGITVLEAYACGLRIVTVNHRDNAGQYIAPKEASIICEPNVAAVAKAITQQLSNNMPVRYARSAGTYDWQALARSLQEAYQQ